MTNYSDTCPDCGLEGLVVHGSPDDNTLDGFVCTVAVAVALLESGDPGTALMILRPAVARMV